MQCKNSHSVGTALLGSVLLLLLVQTGVVAQTQVKNPLTPCKENPAFQELRKTKLDAATASNREYLTNKFELYGEKASCGEDGLPHLIVDGRLDHAGDFIIPSLLFLWLATALGWAGRAYLMESNRNTDDEINIDIPRAVKFLALSFLWPVFVIQEFLAGRFVESDDKITISPR